MTGEAAEDETEPFSAENNGNDFLEQYFYPKTVADIPTGRKEVYRSYSYF